MNTPEKTVIMTCNELYAPPAKYALHSLGITSPDIERVIYMASDFSSETVSGLHAIAREVDLVVEVRDSSSYLENPEIPADHSRHLPKDAWMRLLIPQVCTDLSSYVYADTDVQYMRDLKPLMSTDLEGNILGAVQDVFFPTIGMASSMSGFELDPGNKEAPYFNTGVLLVDANAWRDADITAQALRFAQEHGNAYFFDQDALNAVIRGRWLQLDPEWNVPPFSDMLGPGKAELPEGRPDYDPRELEGRARIIHFMGDFNPWEDGYAAGRRLDDYRQTAAAVKKILQQR
jgi:lipopolysaccharide biosynthesis glycosyltransferase